MPTLYPHPTRAPIRKGIKPSGLFFDLFGEGLMR